MPSPLQSLDESLAYERYSAEDCQRLDRELEQLRRFNGRPDPQQHLELYEYVCAKVEYLSDIINRGEHHINSMCYFYLFDFTCLVKLLSKEERRKYGVG